MEPVLEVQGITKRFGAVLACDDVSLSVNPGEVRGLLGQNGAGKSTLMKIVAGIGHADRGRITVRGRELPPGDPHAARDAGVGMVHQHFSLVEPLTVWENVALGEASRLDERAGVARVGDLGERYGLEVDPYARVDDLAPGERQRVEILKCLRNDPQVVVLDEPTSVLTQTESARLFEVLGMLVRDQGRAVILISHRLEEVLEVTDRITVLRDGAVVSTLETAAADANMLATEMLGRSVTLSREGAAVGMAALGEGIFGGGAVEHAPEREPSASVARASVRADSTEVERPSVTERPVLEVDDIVVVASGQRVLDGLSLHVRAGEVLGIAGVEGNGQAPLADVLSGMLRLQHGSVAVDGNPLRLGHRRDPRDIGVVPPDRHAAGCVLQLSIAENLILDHPEEVEHRGVLSRRRIRERAERLVADFGIVTPSVDMLVGALSGGNQQRVVLARELSRHPKVLVVSQPTQGLDVGAMEDIWARLRGAAAAGTAVLLISTDLDEIIALSDRVGVMYRGQINGEMSRDALDRDRLGLLMGGAAA